MAITVTSITALLQVYDMHKSVAFYRDTLGFEVVHKYEPDGRF
jgi:catechol 2,3-dioxygenase-like lactoylglutathione lyase family enzyme